jgi:hypothetical protein
MHVVGSPKGRSLAYYIIVIHKVTKPGTCLKALIMTQDRVARQLHKLLTIEERERERERERLFF